MKNKRLIALLGVLNTLWLGFIYSNSLKNKEASAAQSKPLAELIKPLLTAVGVTDDTDRIAGLIVRKAAHITEFFVLALLCYGLLRGFGIKAKSALWASGGICIAAAAVDETVQRFSARGAAVTDVLIDLIGVALALALIIIIRTVKKHKSKKRLKAIKG